MNRENRIDIIRGLAMITIALNHMGALLDDLGYQGINIPTLTHFGYSSSAEIFFLVSGYMVGLVYLGKANLKSKIFSRAGKIYLYNLLTYILVIALVYFLPNKVEVATDLNYSLDNPLSATAKFLLLLQHPYLLGVLQLYVLLMLLTPAAAALLQHSKVLFFCISGSLFLATKFFPHFNLPRGSPDGDWLWNFNPFA